ncbi:MAG: nicotinate-nicotinamide nucleotide adenylyltransferase [Chloroflexi bacterium]|nr:MAG: nicotinate-nicotinamide nucleotide adenylyltransferase [Chloroflexota bacterium]
MTRVGVFGGTFDPVHVGHLAIANAALDELGLDRVYFVPARRSPLKQDGPVASAEARLAMLTSATATEPRFKVSGIELDRKGPSFTVDTLEELRGEGDLFPCATLFPRQYCVTSRSTACTNDRPLAQSHGGRRGRCCGR